MCFVFKHRIRSTVHVLGICVDFQKVETLFHNFECIPKLLMVV